ncbi:substrate-binding domain-containing protein [Pseudarthrobacter cellobiosi]|uniref:substrate-binding domain-containing protein n=1 Tax=Pseudarthrobacter cellobiosi TaxID=2953654 RepID=UPI00208FD507|nr:MULTISPECIES: substrate-binding domain-containing protein [unclassified Pseudarthrobacter]MCO4256381.1 substrate-binding domain-containing protein [Pseudarthrobacter sp. HLT1-5]MCO4275564.1 substrate-binding domain-containing protein [Pseudarthrobacter sp. HLT3-5]
MKPISTFKRGLGVIAMAGVATLALAGCTATSNASSTTGLADKFGSRAENRSVYFLTYYNPAGDAFWAQILKGAEDASTLGGLQLTHQTADADPDKMVDLVATATASKPAVIVMPFNEGEKWVKVACDASKAGIKVVAYNVPAPESAADCVSGFVGQDFFEVGTLVGERLAAEAKLGAGDKVLFPAEEPEQNYAIQRGGGVQKALDKVGAKGEYLRTSASDEEALNSLTSWLIANKDVKAVAPLGGTPHRNILAAMEAAGVKVPIVGFDTSPQVIDGIKAGDIIATADQQGFVQGFQSLMQSALAIDFGLAPANINSGGVSLIDKTNVQNLEAPDLQGVRW